MGTCIWYVVSLNWALHFDNMQNNVIVSLQQILLSKTLLERISKGNTCNKITAKQLAHDNVQIKATIELSNTFKI